MGLRKETISPVRDIPVGYFNITNIQIDKGGFFGVRVGMWGSAKDRYAGKPPRDEHTFFLNEKSNEALRMIYAELLNESFFEGAEAVFEPKSITLVHPGEVFVGDAIPLQYTISPSEFAEAEVVWDSSNPEICCIEDGVLKVLNPGASTIQARIKDTSCIAVIDVYANIRCSQDPLASEVEPAEIPVSEENR